MASESADGGAGAGFAPCVCDFSAEKRSQSRFDESPGAHILRFFLAPNELRVFWKRLKHFAQSFLSEWVKLLDTNQRCVLNFAFSAILKQVVINFTGAKDDALHFVERTRFG